MKTKPTKSIYILEDIANNVIKVGMSQNVEQRTKQINYIMKTNATIYWKSIPVFNFDLVEKNVHEVLKDHRVVGEWFSCSPEAAKQAILERVPEIEYCDISEMYINGLNPTQIAEQTNMSRSGIVKYLKRVGIYYQVKADAIKEKLDYVERIEPKLQREEKEKRLQSQSTGLDIEAMRLRNEQKIKERKNNPVNKYKLPLKSAK